MNNSSFSRFTRSPMLSTAFLLVTLAAGCGGDGGRDPILGAPVAPPEDPLGATDRIRPRVTATVPLAASVIAPSNAAITATFTEDMTPATIHAVNFTVMDTTTPPGTAVTGDVDYSVDSRTAVFRPAASLTMGNTYEATINGIGTNPAADLAGNALAGNTASLPAASDYVWAFTAAGADLIAPTVILTAPAHLDTDVRTNTAVNATFSKSMDPLTINDVTFTLQASGPPLGPVISGLITFNPLTNIATFTPSDNLAPSTNYTATVTAGAMDLAGNILAAGVVPNPWTFTTGTLLTAGPVALGSAGSFGIMATAAITNTGASTLINGDVSLEPGTSNGLLPVQVNGTIHINDSVSHQARADLLTAYNSAKNLAPGTTIPGGSDLAALYPSGIPPGTYTSGSTMLVSTPLTLDAMGNANAVWVFQIGSSLTTTSSISLANGAQAKNVFWVPTMDATVGVGTLFSGNIVSGRDVTAMTGATIEGRILAGATLAGTIALDTNTVNVPAP